jgi:hypothetical protein
MTGELRGRIETPLVFAKRYVSFGVLSLNRKIPQQKI